MYKSREHKKRNFNGKSSSKDKILCGRKVDIVSNQDIINYINSKIHHYFKCSQYDHMENDHLNFII